MKFIWRYVWNKMKEIGNEPEPCQENMGMAISRGSKLSTATMSPDTDWGDGLNIQVHSAHGGKIITFRKYDRKSDRNNTNIYLIPEDKDFERELGKLITLESMRG
jgi:hypothetical protein